MGGQRPLAPPSASSGTSSPGEGAVRGAVAFGRRPGRRCFRRGEAGRPASPRFTEGPGASGRLAAGPAAEPLSGRRRTLSRSPLPAPRLFGRQREGLPWPDSAPLQGGRRPRRLGKGGSERPSRDLRPRRSGGKRSSSSRPAGEGGGLSRRMPRGAVGGNGGEMESGGCVPPGLDLGRNWAAPPARRPPSSRPSPAVPRGGGCAEPGMAPMEESWL